MSQRPSKYIAAFDYFDRTIIFFSARGRRISNALFATVIGAPIGIASASFSLPFSMTTGIVRNLFKTTRNKKKQHNKIVMLARNKLNSVESTTSEGPINNEISHKDFRTNIKEEKSYREMKEIIRMMKSLRRDIERNELIEDF